MRSTQTLMHAFPKLWGSGQPHGLRPYEANHQKNRLSCCNQQLLYAAVGVRHSRPALQKFFLALQKDEAHRQRAGWVNAPPVPSFEYPRDLRKHLVVPLFAGTFHWFKYFWILPCLHGCPKIKLRTVDHEMIRLVVFAVNNKMLV